MSGLVDFHCGDPDRYDHLYRMPFRFGRWFRPDTDWVQPVFWAGHRIDTNCNSGRTSVKITLPTVNIAMLNKPFRVSLLADTLNHHFYGKVDDCDKTVFDAR